MSTFHLGKDSPVADVDRAAKLPIEDCNLSVTVGRDGIWLHFASTEGLHYAVNVENEAAKLSPIMGKALLAWARDRRANAGQKV